MSWYVKRTKVLSAGNAHAVMQVGWVGPIKSSVQASKEANAWMDAGWTVSCYESSPAIVAEVRAWQKAADARRAER